VLPVRFSTGQAAQAATHTDERMTVNFQDIPTRTLLQLLSETSGRTLVVDESVTGSVTLSINNVPWDQVLAIVLFTKGLEKRMEGDTIAIAAAGVLAAREREDGFAAR
jgi:type IV pilus assembly protein PilQ